jgi:hypothetical protein
MVDFQQKAAEAAGNRMPSETDLNLRRHSEGRLLGLRINRYSWWVHARELADFFLPRRYKWLITPNQMGRGSPINQHILDSTPTLAARNLASGMMYGITNPTTPWFRLKIGRTDSTGVDAAAIWLAQVEEILNSIMQGSNFYQSLAILYFDLVIFGTGSMLIYQDHDHVINCVNPCFGEYYVDVDYQLARNDVFYREFTYTVAQTVDRWGIEKVSPDVRALYEGKDGSGKTREIVIAHAIEPNTESAKYGVPSKFAYREVYWQWGGSAAPQGGSTYAYGLLEKRGFYEACHITPRWDTVANDAYGRSPAMDALPDCKQLQLEVRRQAQGIDKLVNPPLIADQQLKNQPAQLIPGGITYIAGLMSSSQPGMTPVYGNWKPELAAMSENLELVRNRIKEIFFNNLFQTISQYQTRSNVTAEEINARRAESLIMLGPVLERLQLELLQPAVERIYAIASRGGLLPPAPANIQGGDLQIEYISMLSIAQQASKTSGMDRIMQLAGNLAGADPQIMDKIDFDYLIERYNYLMNNDPKIIRPEEAVQKIRQMRDQQQQQAAAAQQADTAQKMATGAQTLSQTDLGGGQNALQQMLGRATT